MKIVVPVVTEPVGGINVLQATIAYYLWTLQISCSTELSNALAPMVWTVSELG